MSSSSWPAQNKHNSSFGEFLFSSHNALVGYFSFLLIFSYIYCIFWFGVFNDFVCECICLFVRMFLMFSMFLLILFVLFYSGSYCVSLFSSLREIQRKTKVGCLRRRWWKGSLYSMKNLFSIKKVFSSIYHFSHLNNSTFVLHDLVPVLYWTIFPTNIKRVNECS